MGRFPWTINTYFVIIVFVYGVVGRLSDKYPVVIIPGDGGCQAYCKLKNSTSPPFLVWIDLRYFLEPGKLSEYFGLIYDPITRTSRNPDNSDVLFPGWGETWSIENLDSYKHGRTEYCGPMIDSLRLDPFFVSNWTIRGAPFDFRKAPNENNDFNDKLMHLIEETYRNGGNRPVVLLGHSLGAKYAMHFLKSMKKSWKNMYIKTFVSLSAPLGGSVKALKIEASGDNFGVFLRSPLSFRPVQRTLPSLAFLLPDSRLWSPTEPIIMTPTTNYSAHDYERFFRDINYSIGILEDYLNFDVQLLCMVFDHLPPFTNKGFVMAVLKIYSIYCCTLVLSYLGFQMMLDSKPVIDTFEKPSDIDEIYCIHGANLSTTDQLIYSPANFFHSGFPDQVPTMVPGNGDGTVSLRSLEVCKHWSGVKYHILPGAEHVNIMGDPRFIDLIRQIVGANITNTLYY
ncbi:Phosphatidylcholine-sterol acyltransferase [Schistosoma japonicum]|nr:Phosphatidylcholine-sterol acyltransferase [Schistosoma japonicum]